MFAARSSLRARLRAPSKFLAPGSRGNSDRKSNAYAHRSSQATASLRQIDGRVARGRLHFAGGPDLHDLLGFDENGLIGSQLAAAHIKHATWANNGPLCGGRLRVCWPSKPQLHDKQQNDRHSPSTGSLRVSPWGRRIFRNSHQATSWRIVKANAGSITKPCVSISCATPT